MTGRIRLVGQVAAVAVVAALLGLLAWKLTQDESAVTAQLDKGGSPTAPGGSQSRITTTPSYARSSSSLTMS